MFPCWLLSPSYYFVCQMNASLLSHANIDHHNTESRIQDVYHFALFQCIPCTHLDTFDYKHLHPREVWLHAVFCLPAASLSDDFQHWSSIYKKKITNLALFLYVTKLETNMAVKFIVHPLSSIILYLNIHILSNTW